MVCVAVDVRPSLDGAPLDLEARDDVMAFCAREAETILLRHGDPVIERVPEGLIAVFGARETHEDEGLRAVRAATALNGGSPRSRATSACSSSSASA